jgi:1-acyl-sn-glycerol-3-phosphate acyltransferase
MLAPESKVTLPRERVGAMRFAWGVIATSLSLFYTLILAPFGALAVIAQRHRVVARLVWLWSWLMIRTCGIEVRFDGLENLAGFEPCVLIANHQSFFDVFAMLADFPVELIFVAKKELLKIPAVGFVIGRSEHIVIDRDMGGRAIRRAVKALRDGRIVAIFPEGQRFSDGGVHPFDEGAAWLAILSQRPAVPISISGSGRIFPPKALVVVPGGQIRFIIGKPILTEGLHSADRTMLTRRLEDAVRANVTPGA